MKPIDWHTEYPRFAQVFKDKLGSKETSPDLIDGYEELITSICKFIARLAGPRGASAVMARSIQSASSQSPVLRLIRMRDGLADFTPLREIITETLGPPVLSDAFLLLGVMILRTLWEIIGDVATEPLLSHLEATLLDVTDVVSK